MEDTGLCVSCVCARSRCFFKCMATDACPHRLAVGELDKGRDLEACPSVGAVPFSLAGGVKLNNHL